MNVRLFILLVSGLPGIVQAQARLPADIHPVTLSRLPPATPDMLDEEARRLLAARTNYQPGPGPAHVTVFSPNGRSVGSSSGEDSPIGARMFQLVVLVAMREIDQAYEWSSHEPRGLEQGLEQSVIDVVKFNKDVVGMDDRDATVITFGRTLLRENRVSSELWKKMVDHFGVQNTVDILSIMGNYIRVGIMLNAVDQHVPPTRQALLPPLAR